MGSFARKFKRARTVEFYNAVEEKAKEIAGRAINKAVQEAEKRGVETGMARVMAVTAEIVYNDFGKLRNKETRLKVYADLMAKKLPLIANPTEEQLRVEKLLYEQTGIKFLRDGEKRD